MINIKSVAQYYTDDTRVYNIELTLVNPKRSNFAQISNLTSGKLEIGLELLEEMLGITEDDLKEKFPEKFI